MTSPTLRQVAPVGEVFFGAPPDEGFGRAESTKLPGDACRFHFLLGAGQQELIDAYVRSEYPRKTTILSVGSSSYYQGDFDKIPPDDAGSVENLFASTMPSRPHLFWVYLHQPCHCDNENFELVYYEIPEQFWSWQPGNDFYSLVVEGAFVTGT
ncbi:MAG: hypothetical protein AAF456_10025 [Planctomycetota bacterium]